MMEGCWKTEGAGESAMYSTVTMQNHALWTPAHRHHGSRGFGTRALHVWKTLGKCECTREKTQAITLPLHGDEHDERGVESFFWEPLLL